ncbi:MAG: hypothetical protein IPI14_04485 [Polaromonas sp.]|nr:hypothetical protein [Polaromonas sp.]
MSCTADAALRKSSRCMLDDMVPNGKLKFKSCCKRSANQAPPDVTPTICVVGV